MHFFASNIEDKFWFFVTKTDGCWLWNGSRQTSGHGQIRHKQKLYPAHRVAYELCIGPIPDGLLVLHKCDNPPCVNPEHLELGTHKKNHADGRDRLGQAHQILTPKTVAEIKGKLRAGFSYSNLATEYGVTKGSIAHIKSGRQWAEIEPTEVIIEQEEV